MAEDIAQSGIAAEGLRRWVPVVGFEGLYEVSDHGDVRSLGRVQVVAGSVSGRQRSYERTLKPLVMAPTLNKTWGYLSVSLFGLDGVRSVRRVNTLVLEAFIGPRPEGHEGCHDDGIKTNNRLSNLYWGTPTANAADKRRHGTMLVGELSPKAVLKKAEVEQIRDLKGQVSRKALGCRFGVSVGQIRRIHLNESWKEIGA